MKAAADAAAKVHENEELKKQVTRYRGRSTQLEKENLRLVKRLETATADAWEDAHQTYRKTEQSAGAKMGYLEACEDFLEHGPEKFRRMAYERQGYHPRIIEAKMRKECFKSVATVKRQAAGR